MTCRCSHYCKLDSLKDNCGRRSNSDLYGPHNNALRSFACIKRRRSCRICYSHSPLYSSDNSLKLSRPCNSHHTEGKGHCSHNNQQDNALGINPKECLESQMCSSSCRDSPSLPHTSCSLTQLCCKWRTLEGTRST